MKNKKPNMTFTSKVSTHTLKSNIKLKSIYYSHCPMYM